MSYKTKKTLKAWAVGLIVLSAFSIAGEMDYQDEIAKHSKGCESATYAFDNKLECGG